MCGVAAAQQAGSQQGCGGGSMTTSTATGAWLPNQELQMSHAAHDAGTGEHAGHLVGQAPPVTAESEARARAILAANMEMFSGVTWDQTLPSRDGTLSRHRQLTPEQKAAYAAKYPGLPIPSGFMFDKPNGTKVIGMMFGKGQAENIGYGATHQHREGGVVMQHIWFLPNDLPTAFNDIEGKEAALKQLA